MYQPIQYTTTILIDKNFKNIIMQKKTTNTRTKRFSPDICANKDVSVLNITGGNKPWK